MQFRSPLFQFPFIIESATFHHKGETDMIPYRTRNLLRKLMVTGLVLLLIVAVLLLCWFLWLNRFVIYTRGGALLDFGLSPEFSEGQQAESQEPGETVDIYSKITKFNGLKMDIAYRVVDHATGVIRCTGESSHAFLDKEYKPIRMKRDYPDLYEMFMNYLAVE